MHPVQPHYKTPTRKDVIETTSSRPKTLILSANGTASVPFYLRKNLDTLATTTYLANREPLDPASFVALASGYDYIAITRRAIGRIDRLIIEALPQLKGISAYSTGLEWIDEEALRKRNIRLLGLPDYCTNAVAETALGLMLMTAHKLHLRYLKSIRMIPDSVSLRGFELKYCNIGIIGFGRIGRKVAEKAASLSASVTAYDINDRAFDSPHPGVIRKTPDQILTTSDFIICCASQSFAPQQLLLTEQYACLRPETVIINIGRTSLLNHDLLVKMVKRHQIRAYIYDDLMRDIDRPNEKEYGKIIPTGHTAWYSDESIANGTESWINNLLTLCKTT
jgi:lactate dehydrogenase-like 2-hydroxyacid dehydrogenase